MRNVLYRSVLFGTADALSRGLHKKSQKVSSGNSPVLQGFSRSVAFALQSITTESSVLRTVLRVCGTATPQKATRRTRRHVAAHGATRRRLAERFTAMGGNGTFALGKMAQYRWETVGKIEGVKVLELKDRGLSRKLPEEAHSSRMYIQLHDDGTFSQLRIYDKWHRLRVEIGYHPERRLDP